MNEKAILLSIESLGEAGFSGWCARRNGPAFRANSLYIETAAGMTAISDFTFREDLKAARLGDGVCAFHLPGNFAPDDVVAVYDQTTLKRLWSGRVKEARPDLLIIPLEEGRGLERPEGCLFTLSENGVSAPGGDGAGRLHPWKTRMTVRGQNVLYFQLIGKAALFATLRIEIENCDTQLEYVCSFEGQSIHECIVMPREQPLQNMASRKCVVSVQNNAFTLELSPEDCPSEEIFLLCSDGIAYLRPNVPVAISESLAFACPKNNPDYRILKSSFLKLSNGRLIGSPACVRAEDAGAAGARNRIVTDVVHSYAFREEIAVDYESSMRILQTQGADGLVSALYRHILKREGDPEGLKSKTVWLENKLKESAPVSAINALWRELLDSPEFRKQKFCILNHKLIE